MRYVAIVRHGDYKADGTLKQVSTVRLSRAAEFLADRVQAPVRIACSVQARAKNSADILAGRLIPIGIDYYDELATGRDAPIKKYARGDMEAVHVIVEHSADDAQTVVLVTHYEVCNHYPDFYIERVFGAGSASRPMRRSEALIIDSETGDCELLESEGFVLSWNSVSGDGLERIRY